MTVYCLIPVHNRLDQTKTIFRCLKEQDFKDIHIVVVDDGSTDGTSDYIRQHEPAVELIVGDGSLWWGGAMWKGLGSILPVTKQGDYVLFLNDDTSFRPDYVSKLVAVSESYSRAVVGSTLMDLARPNRILSLAPRIRYGLARVEELYHPDLESIGDSNSDLVMLPAVIEVDALSGRGTLYPVEVLSKIGTARRWWLPHYLADYELSVRAKAAGYKTLVCTQAVVWTGADVSGLNPANAGIFERLFSRRSRSNILDHIAFFLLCGPWYWRLTAPVRVVLLRCWSAVRRKRPSGQNHFPGTKKQYFTKIKSL